MKKEKKKEQENNESFIRQVASLPRPLQVRFLRHIGTAIAMLVLTVFMVIYFQTWSYSICSLISLYIAYLGCDIVWSSQSEKIICRKMVCVKANKVLKQDRLYAIMRELDDTIPEQDAVHRFYFVGPKKELALITPNTILNVYFRPDTQLEVVAWEIIDYIGS